jgi:hypothetical protein
MVNVFHAGNSAPNVNVMSSKFFNRFIAKHWFLDAEQQKEWNVVKDNVNVLKASIRILTQSPIQRQIQASCALEIARR